MYVCVCVCVCSFISIVVMQVMIPIPQYPLYSATITLCNGKEVPYYLVRPSTAMHLEETKGEEKERHTHTATDTVTDRGTHTQTHTHTNTHTHTHTNYTTACRMKTRPGTCRWMSCAGPLGLRVQTGWTCVQWL